MGFGASSAFGGRFASWALYVKDKRLKYCHNHIDIGPNPAAYYEDPEHVFARLMANQ